MFSSRNLVVSPGLERHRNASFGVKVDSYEKILSGFITEALSIRYEATVHPCEYIADDRAEHEQNYNNYHGNQKENKSVLDQALASFMNGTKHNSHLLSIQNVISL